MRSYENADGQKQTGLNIVQRMFMFFTLFYFL
jgi:hypothetical protein